MNGDSYQAALEEKNKLLAQELQDEDENSFGARLMYAPVIKESMYMNTKKLNDMQTSFT